MTLNAKQWRFVRAYLVDPNATQAATTAGYSAKTAYSQGQRLLKHAEVRLQVTAGQMEQAARNKLTEDQVVAGLRKEAELYGEGSAHGARVAAWTQLGKHLGMFTDKQTHEGEVVIRIIRESKAA